MTAAITNYLSPVEFILSIKRLPNVMFFVQRASIPAISLNPISKFSPLNPTWAQADSLTYSELNISFIIDAQMNNYVEIYNWMHGITFPQRNQQWKNLVESEHGLRSDISLIIHNSSKNPGIEFTFKDCFPTTLSEVTLDTTASDIVYPEASVTFAYDWFEITQIS